MIVYKFHSKRKNCLLIITKDFIRLIYCDYEKKQKKSRKFLDIQTHNTRNILLIY